MSNITETEAIHIAETILSSNGLGYDTSEGFTAKFSRDTKLRDGRLTSAWVVSYVTPPSLFEQHDHFMYISDETKDVLYIMTQSGYIEKAGS